RRADIQIAAIRLVVASEPFFDFKPLQNILEISTFGAAQYGARIVGKKRPYGRVVQDLAKISCARQRLQLAALALELIAQHFNLLDELAHRRRMLDRTISDAGAVNDRDAARLHGHGRAEEQGEGKSAGDMAAAERVDCEHI